jgi:hypothetical protein
VLCLSSGTFLGLNGSARAIWNSLITTGSEVEAAERLHLHFAIELAAARTEVRRFIESCRQQTLLDPVDLDSISGFPNHTGRSSHRYVGPSVPSAISSIVRTRALLRFGGFAKAYWGASEVSERYGTKGETTIKSITRALGMFLKAEGLLPSRRGHNDCLFRSLALFRFLRATGASVAHHIGVTEHPFEAHAWVAFENAPLLNDPQKIVRYKRIADLPLEPR